MDDLSEVRWREFETLGEVEVRKRLAQCLWGEEKEALARQWIEWRVSLSSSDSIARTLALAREANDLALSSNEEARKANTLACDANSTARESAATARNNSIIATLALVAAIISIALSIIGLFLKL